MPNEKITDEQKKRVGYFVFHNNKWWLVNEGLPDLMDVSSKKIIAIGSKVELIADKQLLLDKHDGGRLVHIQMVEA